MILGASTATATPDLSTRLGQAFEEAFARTDVLFDRITPEAYECRPIPLRHPIVFYEGHLAAFVWNTLFRRVLGQPAFNPEFDRLFERGIDPGNQDAADALAIHTWPSREEIQAYVREIRQRLFEYLAGTGWPPSAHPLLENGQVLWLILEHELMHHETLLYILHQLPSAMKRKPADYVPAPTGPAPAPKMVTVPAGQVLLGARPGEYDFAWDNEQPAIHVNVSPFAMDAYNVTNGQFLEFVEAGGYQNPEWWTPKTWPWKEAQQKSHPFFWKSAPDGQWLLRDFFEDILLPPDWPVYVTHAEAEAYARYVGKALPTEAEWHRAAYGDQQGAYPWGNSPPTPKQGNIHFKHWSPVPVGTYPQAASPYGIHDLLGNGWEWTATPFAPFPGFEASAGYPQYSADFFDGAHYVIKGGSCFTDARLLRRSFRNWFYWHYPYMYATFRCVKRS